jgi:hypothetical protein
MSIHAEIKFDKASHTYTWKGRNLTAVSSVIKEIVPEFDRAGLSAKVAKREGKPVSVILAEWDAKRDKAAANGTAMHAQIQNTIGGGQDEGGVEWRAWRTWWDGASKTITVRDVEKIIGDAEFGIAGTLDALVDSQKSGLAHILDWKSNSKFRMRNDWGTKLLPPFDDLDDCEFERYSIQVSLYRLILERNGEPEMGDSWLIHLGDHATAHKAMDRRQRLEKWLKNCKSVC